MELYYLLFLFLFNCFDVEALLRVEREATCPQIANFSGGVEYKRKGTKAVFRCPETFRRYGSKFAICQDDRTWSEEPPICIKKGCLPLDQSLVSNLIMEVDVENKAVVKFSCDQDYHLIGETLAYCNGTDWSAPLPRCAAPHETECDFEDDLCGWTQDDSDEQDWIRTLGSAQSGNTGPKYDHTYGDTVNGHFLFFETSNPTITSHEAILYSPVYNKHLSPMCFDFWYHVLGPNEASHVGSLEVFVSDESQYSDVDDNLPLFVKEGNQGDKWQRGDIFIDSQVESYQIIIVATRALNYTSGIAIDDVRLYNCSRKNETGQATTMPQTSTTPTHLIKKSTTTMTQTTRGIKSTKAISTTNITETGTQLPTTVTIKEINPSFKPATTIKKGAQSISVSHISDLTKALPSIATTAMAQTTTVTRPSKTESTNTTTQTSSTPKLPTTESTTITTQTSAIQRFSTAKSITTASQTSTTPNRSRTGSTTETTQTSSTPRMSSTTSLNKFSLPSKDKTSSKMRTSTSKTSTSSSSTLITTRNDLSTTRQTSTDHMNDITGKEKVISISQNTNTEKTQISTSGTTHVSKPTKRTNALTTKQSIISKKTRGNSISVSNERSHDIENEILTSLVIGLCVGIVAGSIIIFVIACVCVRRRKFITSSYEGELKPMKNSDSV